MLQPEYTKANKFINILKPKSIGIVSKLIAAVVVLLAAHESYAIFGSFDQLHLSIHFVFFQWLLPLARNDCNTIAEQSPPRPVTQQPCLQDEVRVLPKVPPLPKSGLLRAKTASCPDP